MGYDAFGLPAEQYAIQTGQPPQKTTADNIKRYREHWINWVFLMTGTVRYVLVIRPIINGPNGLF
jgi:hypothetical protein